MTDPRTITISHPEHGDLEVALPDGFVSPEEIAEGFVPKAVHNNEMARLRTSSKNLADPQDLLGNEEFREKALEAWGVSLNAQSQDDAEIAKQLAERVEAKRAEWDRSVLSPVQKQLESLQSEVVRLRDQQLQAEIMSAAAGLVKKGLLKTPEGGRTAPIVNMLKPFFKYDEQTGQWAVANGDGFAYSNSPTESAPYKSAREFLKEWTSDPDNVDFLSDTRQRGPDMGTGEQARGGVIRLSYEESKNAQTYRAARERAEKTGAQLVVDYPS